MAHLNRGILRATALQRVLLARAATGRDIKIVSRRIRTDETQPTPADPQTEPPADQPAARKAAPRPSLPLGSNDPELFMPTLEDLERQVRRRAVGRTIADICRDPAVVPGLCNSAFWNDLFQIMHYFGGSVATLNVHSGAGSEARQHLGLVASETRRNPPGPGLLHWRGTGRSIRPVISTLCPCHGNGHRPTLTPA
jgi:hypothetical protein